MLKLIPALIIVLVHTATHAEEIWQGIKVTCGPNKFIVESHLLRNQEPMDDIVVLGDGSVIHYVSDSFTCKLPKNIIHGEIIRPSSASGMCAALPGSNVSILVNDELVFRNQLFTNECYESLNKVYFLEHQSGELVLEFCGDTGTSAFVPRVNGCFQYPSGAFERLTKPLNPSPISKLLKRDLLQ